MKRIAAFLLLMARLAVGAEPMQSVKLVVGSGDWARGEPLWVMFEVVLGEGFHTYWQNPGEAGMVPSVQWQLPAGWKAEALCYPVPKEFTTSGLVGYGYEGRVSFPLRLLPSAASEKPVSVHAKFSMLVCNDAGCNPSDTEHELSLPVENAGEIQKRIDQVRSTCPEPLAGAVLGVERKGEQLELVLDWPEGAAFVPSAAKVFPATSQVVGDGAEIVFSGSGKHWQALVSASEYLRGGPAELELVFVPEAKTRACAVSWKK